MLMDHKGVMTRKLTAKIDVSNEISHRLYPKHDSVFDKGNVSVPTHLATSKILNKDSSPERLGTAEVRQTGERCRLKTAFHIEENASWDSGVSNVTRLQHSDASNELIECMSEKSVNMKYMTLLPLLNNIRTFEQNKVYLGDGSVEESIVMVPEAAASTFDEINSVNGVPWAWSDGSSDESAVMDLESPLSTLESMTCPKMYNDTEFRVTSQKIVSPACSNEARVYSNSRSLKQETSGTLCKGLKSVMASSSKEQKNGFKIDEKQKRELPMLRSSLPVRTSLLGRVKAKKKVEEAPNHEILNKNSSTLDSSVDSVMPKKTGVIMGPATPLTPIIIKKLTLSPPTKIQLSPRPTALPKTKPPALKDKSSKSISGGIPGQISKTVSKPGKEKVDKQIGALQASKSTIYCSSGSNYPKLRSVKSHVDARKNDEVVEKTRHAVEQKVTDVALNSVDQKDLKSRAQQSSKRLSFRSAMPPSTLVLARSKEETQFTKKAGSGSGKALIDEVKGRTLVSDCKRIQKGTMNVGMEDKSVSPGNLLSGTLVRSSSKAENDGSKLILSNACGSKKTWTDEGKGRSPCFDNKRIQKTKKFVSMEDKSLSPEMMSFRTGKEASLQKANTGERPVRLIQEKAASKEKNFVGEIRDSMSRKSKESITASSPALSPCSPRVVLMHQDSQEKNTRASFNVEFEEIANKLVEIRKSKVKALVSVFESIISLQGRTV